MKYSCLNETCGKLFVYSAKKVELISNTDVTIETHVCPYCQSIDIEEYTPEPAPQPQITSVVSVELAQVDSYLKQGYVVRELYAKTATLVKLEAKA